MYLCVISVFYPLFLYFELGNCSLWSFLNFDVIKSPPISLPTWVLEKKLREELQDSGFFLEVMTRWKLFCFFLDFAYCLSADAWILWQHIPCLVLECVPGSEWDCHLICRGMFVSHNKFAPNFTCLYYGWICWAFGIHNWCHSTFELGKPIRCVS